MHKGTKLVGKLIFSIGDFFNQVCRPDFLAFVAGICDEAHPAVGYRASRTVCDASQALLAFPVPAGVSIAGEAYIVNWTQIHAESAFRASGFVSLESFSQPSGSTVTEHLLDDELEDVEE